MEKLSQGAEAVIYREKDAVIKKRLKKNYRIPEIDEKLRLFRTRREAKILDVLSRIKFPAPALRKIDDKNKNIEMGHIKGAKLRDVINETNYQKICSEIGTKVAILHNNGIIHSDLTTSNMIFNKKIYFIDFGLSFFSDKIEDRAVDLHLLKQALDSKHHKISEKGFKIIMVAYMKTAAHAKEVHKRLEIVEGRGRNKHKSA